MMELANVSGTIVVDYVSYAPTSVSVEGATSYTYEKPVLKITASGNVTVTDLYKLTATLKDRLGNPLDFYITIDGEQVPASNGIASKLVPPATYEVEVPAEVSGFKLYGFYPDNSGGGTWSDFVNITLDSLVFEPAVYKVVIDGNNWSIYNYNDVLELQFSNPDFWNVTRSDGNDLRLLDSTGRQLYFWIESWDYQNKKATIYFRVEVGGSEVLFLYGNPSAKKSNFHKPERVFEFFDDFVGVSLDLSKWRTNTNTYKVENGYIKLWGDWNGNDIYLNSIESFESPVVVFSRMKVGQVGVDVDLFVAFMPIPTGIFGKNGIGCIYDSEGTGVDKEKQIDYFPTGETVTGGQVTDTNWHRTRMVVTENEVRFWDDLLGEISMAKGLSTFYLSIGSDSESSSVFGYIDYIALAKASDPVDFVSANVGKISTVKARVTPIADIELPSAEYKVPTKFESKEVRIQKVGFKFPFFSESEPAQDDETPIVRLQGTLKDFYNSPVPNRDITIEISSAKFTRVFNVTTDASGNFVVETDMARGIEYTITYKFAGDDTYVGTSTSKTFYVEELPEELIPVEEITEILIAIAIVIATAGAIVAIAYMAKKNRAVTRARIENEFRFFRKLK